GSIIGDVTNSGTLAFDRSNTYSYAGVISGSGAVTQIGTGTTVLAGDNSYSGGHDDLGRHSAARQWRRDRQHRRQCRQQRHAGFQTQRHTCIFRHHLRHGRGAPARLRHHGAHRSQYL
ncbi:MAG: hypothetical protein E5W55_16100, partial [Mesorhizobium sp.]